MGGSLKCTCAERTTSLPLIESRSLGQVLRGQRRRDELPEDFRPVHLLLHRLRRDVEVAVGRAQRERVARIFDLLWNSVPQLEPVLGVAHENLSLRKGILKIMCVQTIS